MEIVIASICLSFYFVNITNIPAYMKKILRIHFNKRLKPFDCAICLSVWIAGILYFMPYEVTEFIEIAFGSGMALVVISQYTKL